MYDILIATMSSEDFRFEKLTAENYHSWKFNMKMMLIGMDCWEIVEGTEVLPAESTPKQQQDFRKRVNKSLSRICLGVSQNLQIYVRNAKTGKEAWDSLMNHFEEKTLSRKIQFRRKLYSARLEQGNMTDHVNELRTIADHLESLDDPVTEKDLVMILISSLPDAYNNLITTLETLKEDKLTWDYVRDRVLTEYERRNTNNENAVVDDALFVGGDHGGARRSTFFCHYCKESGHIKRNCPQLQAKKKADEHMQSVDVTGREPWQESVSFCRDVASVTEDDDFVPELALHVEMDTGPSCRNKWYLDSACSHHMTGDKSVLRNFKEFAQNKPRYVKLADKSTVRALGQGDMNVYLTDEKNRRVATVFTDVMFVPRLDTSLISIGTLTNRGLVMFGKKYVKLGVKGRNLILGPRRKSNMFELEYSVVG